MIFKIEAKKSLYITEWQIAIKNDLDYDIEVDLGHTEVMVKTITIEKKGTEIPKAFSES